MMTSLPLYVDFVVSVLATFSGATVLTMRMGVFDKDKRTPLLTAMTITCGSLGWSIFALMAFAAITSIPAFAAPKGDWFGSWGYTSARLLIGLGWTLTLLHMSRVVEYMECKREYIKV